jgi:lipoprotein-releasing system permease protein
MRFETEVALRYLAASRRRAHVALIATISIVGLAVGVAALVVSLALLSGFQDRIRHQMAERTAHLTVSPDRGSLLADSETARRALASLPGVTAVVAVLEGRGWASDVEGTAMYPVRFRSAPAEAGRVGAARAASGIAPADVRIARALASRLHVAEDGLVRLTSSRTRLSPVGPIPVSAVLRVAAIRRGSAFENAAEVEVSEETARLLTGVPSGAHALEALVDDPERAELAARALASRLPAGSRVATWRERNAPLAFALRLEKFVIFVTVALVIVVAALNIVSNIALTVVEKKRDLGVLTSMGATPAALRRVYLTLGAVIGVVGTAAGVLIGVLIAAAADRFRLVPLPGDVYMLSHVPFAIHPGEVAACAGFAVATAIAAALLPARAASRLAPGEAIRLSR